MSKMGKLVGKIRYSKIENRDYYSLVSHIPPKMLKLFALERGKLIPWTMPVVTDYINQHLKDCEICKAQYDKLIFLN